MGYKDFLHSDLWENLKSRVLFRDRYKCILCGRKDRFPVVHHLSYDYNTFCTEINLQKLKTLCKRCHRKVHFKGRHKVKDFESRFFYLLSKNKKKKHKNKAYYGIKNAKVLRVLSREKKTSGILGAIMLKKKLELEKPI